MKVTCNSIGEFIENLCLEESIYRKTVYVSLKEQPLDLEREPVRFDVIIQATTIVETEDGGQYIIEAGESCGTDYRDATNELKGTKKRKQLFEKLCEVCEEQGLSIRPGIVSE